MLKDFITKQIFIQFFRKCVSSDPFPRKCRQKFIWCQPVFLSAFLRACVGVLPVPDFGTIRTVTMGRFFHCSDVFKICFAVAGKHSNWLQKDTLDPRQIQTFLLLRVTSCPSRRSKAQARISAVLDSKQGLHLPFLSVLQGMEDSGVLASLQGCKRPKWRHTGHIMKSHIPMP